MTPDHAEPKVLARTEHRHLYGVVGHPIRQSRSPFIHAAFARQTRQELQYAAYAVPPEELAGFVSTFFRDGGDGGGLNITIPHKESVTRLVDRLSPRAQLAGAVNTIVPTDTGLLGDNTDGAGLIADLRGNLGLQFTQPRILVLGAGGAARGILGPLLALRPSMLAIVNRTPARAELLARHFSTLGPITGGSHAQLTGPAFDLVINATAASLAGELPPLPPTAIGPHSVCYDLAYTPGDTPFQVFARAHGAARAENGLGMLVEQAAAAFELWRGVRPATAAVLQALRAAN